MHAILLLPILMEVVTFLPLHVDSHRLSYFELHLLRHLRVDDYGESYYQADCLPLQELLTDQVHQLDDFEIDTSLCSLPFL